MQRVNNRMSHTIDFMYRSSGDVFTFNSPNSFKLNYSLNNVFPLFFRVSLQGNKIELPIFAKSCVQDKLLAMLNLGIRSDIIIPFYMEQEDSNTFRTANSLIRYLVEFNSSRRSMYTSASTKDGIVYYGCNGAIFNKDMVPLIFNVIECEIKEENDSRHLVFKRVKSYIHPSVFYSADMVEKCIANKIIPYVMLNGVEIRRDPNVVNCINYENIGMFRRTIPELSVADIREKFFCKPILPSVLYDNDDINDMLDRNIEDVFNVIGL